MRRNAVRQLKKSGQPIFFRDTVLRDFVPIVRTADNGEKSNNYDIN
jgi:hypothetical protein